MYEVRSQLYLSLAAVHDFVLVIILLFLHLSNSFWHVLFSSHTGLSDFIILVCLAIVQKPHLLWQSTQVDPFWVTRQNTSGKGRTLWNRWLRPGHIFKTTWSSTLPPIASSFSKLMIAELELVVMHHMEDDFCPIATYKLEGVGLWILWND